MSSTGTNINRSMSTVYTSLPSTLGTSLLIPSLPVV